MQALFSNSTEDMIDEDHLDGKIELIKVIGKSISQQSLTRSHAVSPADARASARVLTRELKASGQHRKKNAQ